MKKIFLLSIFLTSVSLHAYSACKIVSFPKVIKLNKVLDESVIKQSDCSREIINTYIDFISGATGVLTSEHLTQIFKSEYDLDIELSPASIEIKSINEILTELIQIPKSLSLTEISSLYSKASLTLTPKDHLQVECKDCESAGEKNIKLLINNSPIWFSIKILSKRQGLVINLEINPFNTNLTEDMFTFTSVFDDGRTHLFHDRENLKFYKANKRLIKGEFLKTTDLSPITLVKMGQKIKVILKGKNVALKSSAISRQSGKIGDFVEVYNQKTSKKISAQVIDFNTVMVEL